MLPEWRQGELPPGICSVFATGIKTTPMRKLTRLLARRYTCTQSYMRIDSAPEEYLRTADREPGPSAASLGEPRREERSREGRRREGPHVPALYFRPGRPVTAAREK